MSPRLTHLRHSVGKEEEGVAARVENEVTLLHHPPSPGEQ